MEKEFVIDQEDVVVVAIDETEEETEEFDYSDISDDQFTSTDESEIDWSSL
jgi:hypothetical protein